MSDSWARGPMPRLSFAQTRMRLTGIITRMLSDKLIFVGTGIPLTLSVLAGIGSVTLVVVQYKRSFMSGGYSGLIPKLLLGLRLTALLIFLLLLLNPVVRLNVSP